jgi:hypothetical protein
MFLLGNQTRPHFLAPKTHILHELELDCGHRQTYRAVYFPTYAYDY